MFVQQEQHKHSGALEHAGDASKAAVEIVSTASLSRAGQEGQIQRIAGQQDHCFTWEPPSGVGGLRGQSGTWSSTCFLRWTIIDSKFSPAMSILERRWVYYFLVCVP